MASKVDEPIRNLLNEHGEMHSNDICAALTMFKDATVRSRLGKLKSKGQLSVRDRSFYSINRSATRQKNDDLEQISNALRTAEDNKKTIDTLMNLYDDVLKRYTAWVADNVGVHTDFENQLLFIENFKWLTAIGDKLMKRWSLEHVGYDTNTRQAQEDAKAKSEERQKAALEDAPLEEQVNIIASFNLDTKQLIEALPTLKSLTEDEAEEIKV